MLQSAPGLDSVTAELSQVWQPPQLLQAEPQVLSVERGDPREVQAAQVEAVSLQLKADYAKDKGPRSCADWQDRLWGRHHIIDVRDPAVVVTAELAECGSTEGREADWKDEPAVNSEAAVSVRHWRAKGEAEGIFLGETERSKTKTNREHLLN